MNPEIFGCSLILQSNDPNKGNFYVGGIESLKQISKHKFGAIISAVEKLEFKIPNHVHHLRIEAFDEPDFDLLSHFEKTCKFIKLYLPKTNVLVHCQVGVSRSVSIMIAYFIKEKQMTPDAALQLIREKRDFISPNDGFKIQLEKFYQECNKDKQNIGKQQDIKQKQK